MHAWFQSSYTDNRGNWERVEEGVGILEWNGGTVDQGPAIIDEAVVVTEALEELGVDEACRAEPAASEVYFRDVATTDTHIHYLYCVGWNATWKRCCGALVDHYIRLAAFLTPYSVRFHSFISIVCTKIFIQNRPFKILHIDLLCDSTRKMTGCYIRHQETRSTEEPVHRCRNTHRDKTLVLLFLLRGFYNERKRYKKWNIPQRHNPKTNTLHKLKSNFQVQPGWKAHYSKG